MKYSEESLVVMKLTELRQVAKILGIKNIHSYKKAELVHVMVQAQAQEAMPVVEDAVDTIVKSSNKAEYLSNIAPDSLVAFQLGSGKVLSGKVIKLEGGPTIKTNALIETKNGMRYMIKLSDILWVKTGARWPKGVYMALKGVKTANEHQRAYTANIQNC